MVDNYEETDGKRSDKEEEDIVEEMNQRFEEALQAWRPTFDHAINDIRFVDSDEENAQWTQQQLTMREGRPVMTFDKVSGACDVVIGTNLKNRPGIKVVGAEDDDTDDAEVIEGLIRQIESRSKAYPTGFKFSAKGGYGAWRLGHGYLDDTAYYQDVILDEVKNPFCVLVDPIVQTAPLHKMRYGFVFEDLSREDFKEEHPEASEIPAGEDFAMPGSRKSNWYRDNMVRVADYYRLVPEDTELVLLTDNRVLVASDPSFEELEDELIAQNLIADRREAKVKRLEHFKMSGIEILKEYKCVGRYVPLVVLFGKTSIVDGEFVSRGLVRKAIDAQRAYNIERSNHLETTALQAKQPYFATHKMIEGHEDKIKRMNVENDPMVIVNADPNVPGGLPVRELPPQPSQGIIAEIQMAADDIKSTTNIYDASKGARSNETSGKAIDARRFQADTANFELTEQLEQAIQYTGMVMVDLIPRIYDTTRQIRILGEDNAEDVVQINKPMMDESTGQNYILHDLSRGRYDVRVRTGPSFNTRREETADSLGDILRAQPELFNLIGDLYLNSLDMVGGDEAIERFRMMGIRQGIIEPDEKERQKLQQQRSPQKELAKQLKQKLAQLEVAEKDAKVRETQSKTQLNAANTRLKSAQAVAEQLEVAITNQDLQGQQIAIMRLLQALGARQVMQRPPLTAA